MSIMGNRIIFINSCINFYNNTINYNGRSFNENEVDTVDIDHANNASHVFLNSEDNNLRIKELEARLLESENEVREMKERLDLRKNTISN